MKKYYLAYGSNLNMEQMSWRCPDASPIGTSTLEGYQLLFKGSGSGFYLTIEPKEGSTVPVGVWQINEKDERELDRYEGFPRFYYKKEVSINCPVGFRKGKIRALIYIMHEDRNPGLPSGRYVQTCLEGYEDFGLDPNHLFAALDTTKERMK